MAFPLNHTFRDRLDQEEYKEEHSINGYSVHKGKGRVGRWSPGVHFVLVERKGVPLAQSLRFVPIFLCRDAWSTIEGESLIALQNNDMLVSHGVGNAGDLT